MVGVPRVVYVNKHFTRGCGGHGQWDVPELTYIGRRNLQFKIQYCFQSAKTSKRYRLYFFFQKQVNAVYETFRTGQWLVESKY